MNILIPDSWLREYLETQATPVDLKRCLSLCGPSVERIEQVDSETIYDIEVTTNRIDSFSVFGIAREAAAILPEFGISATLKHLLLDHVATGTKPLDIKIIDKQKLYRRILAVKLENIKLAPSPAWLSKRLIAVGQRPLNNIIDITNYVMWEFGHPIHAFDFDQLTTKTILVREAKSGEYFTTLDGKTYKTVGGEVILDDGKGNIIDLPGIMGTANTVVTDKTKNVLLFVENGDPGKIRFASMNHAIRTQAAVINEKNPDPELAEIVLKRAIQLAQEITQPQTIGKIVDIYPKKAKPPTLRLLQKKLDSYMGLHVETNKVERILQTLGFSVEFILKPEPFYLVTPPYWRASDIQIPQDVIEEVARIYGYHNIPSHLPQCQPPITLPDPIFKYEEEVKIRLRDWGFTEIYTYSMISEELMDIFQLDKSKTYKISNPLSKEWVYMRPTLWPSMLNTIKENLNHQTDLKLFEISMIYKYQENNLPLETPLLLIAQVGQKFLELKGIAEALFEFFGITFPEPDSSLSHNWYGDIKISLGKYGSLGLVNQNLLNQLGIKQSVTILELDIDLLVHHASPQKTYQPIPKYPPVIEDLTFELPQKTAVGKILTEIKNLSPQIQQVEIFDRYENNLTFRLYYQNHNQQITSKQVQKLRKNIIAAISQKYSAKLKGRF